MPEPNGKVEEAAIERARAVLARARSVVVLTGAGVSAESGVPTFRGEAGLWRRHRPEELATPAAFARDPRLVWEWYAWRREVVSKCRPNAAHRGLARWATRRAGVRIVTQNVDGLHVEAARSEGPDESASNAAWPIELHGSLFRVRCTSCDQKAEHRSAIDATDFASLPRCPACGGLLRPDVVWFGERLDAGALEAAFESARTSRACLVVGTSAIVHPAASVAVAAVEAGATLVEVNPGETPLSRSADVALRAAAARVVPRLLDEPPGPG